MGKREAATFLRRRRALSTTAVPRKELVIIPSVPIAISLSFAPLHPNVLALPPAGGTAVTRCKAPPGAPCL